MALDDIENLRAEAERTRNALEKLAPQLGVSFEKFPVGSCGDSCDFLGEWLLSRGFTEIDYVCGNPTGKSHAWLEVDGVVVDITSDQFENGVGPVYVGEKTAFHESFSKTSRRKHILDATLRARYKKIACELAGAT